MSVATSEGEDEERGEHDELKWAVGGEEPGCNPAPQSPPLTTPQSVLDATKSRSIPRLPYMVKVLHPPPHFLASWPGAGPTSHSPPFTLYSPAKGTMLILFFALLRHRFSYICFRYTYYYRKLVHSSSIVRSNLVFKGKPDDNANQLQVTHVRDLVLTAAFGGLATPPSLGPESQ